MDLEETMLKRRSIRKYSNKEVEKDKIEKILHMAFSGPSACDRMPIEIYVISKKEILQELSNNIRFAKQESPLGMVVCGNMRKALPLQLSDYWIEDASAATENILLAATSLGLGSLWCGVYPEKRKMATVKKILSLPDHHIPLGFIKIGYSEEEKEPRDKYDKSKIHYIYEVE